ncbi:MAG: carbohydrate kinase family protein [Methanobacterium formicicum]|uniref:PfkB domain-containing protein n=1 Tax=Methanobacterium formicicum TaxID=2162 RepID=A0A090IA97_METFO|nr:MULTISPECIES: carbohydrate kinase family protein [Methanobacterium]MDD4811157.1 carbohydrate kinase family protein [Methanobacterium formicicum]MDG3547434.1 carbohydrate kinase family protein [Methanobacterium formicicum]MDH2659481.1 carbohydrate kinase family protein [Methanobacterium formicicum]CEA14347.1 PfkB domain-containing protein [Methanobacterium formicicum]CEL24612.1 PfkB domain-containing protein [Methanobacterium formicicum]
MGFGALNLDRLYWVNKIAGEDEEAYITNIHESCGGSAANTIIGLARLGLTTGFLGKIASDRQGNLLLENLRNEGVDTRGVIKDPSGRSGNVQGFVDPQGQRALYVDPGVNDEITLSEINQDYLSNTRLIHLTSFVGESLHVQEEVLDTISSQVTVSMDPGMIYASKGLKPMEKLLSRTDILLLNQKELELLTPAINREKDKINALLDHGIEILVIKQGEKGCLVNEGEESHFHEAFQVDCRDSTGAGDAFNAGFLYGYLRGKGIEKSAHIGNYVASRCIMMPGAIDGLPSLSQIISSDHNELK